MKTKRFLYITTLLLIGILISCKSTTKEQSKEVPAQWVQLFNGKDLKDWKIKIKGHPLNENYKNTFRVVDGVMQVNYDEYETFDASFGHIFYKNEYSNYKFRMEYRFTGEQVEGGAGWAKRNSGVMIHSPAPETMTLDQDFPISIEVQLLGGLGEGERSTANLCTPGTHVVMNDKLFTPHCTPSSSKTFHGDQWVQLEIIVYNDSLISHKINGEQVLSYSKPQVGGKNVKTDPKILESLQGKPLKKGYISLQSESHPAEFRKIEILDLN